MKDEGVTAGLAIERPAKGVVVLQLFIDARAVKGANAFDAALKAVT